MKPLLTRFTQLACAAGLAVAAQLSAVPLNISASFGAVDPGTPANAATEVLFINNLLSLSDSGENAPSFPPLLDDGTFANTGGTLYDRFDTMVPAGAPDATATGGMQGVAPATPLDLGAVGSWNYLLGKFGNSSYVWYVGNLGGPIELQSDLGQGGGLSHYSLYNPGTTTVPDGGVTVALLGLVFAMVAVVRRRYRV